MSRAGRPDTPADVELRDCLRVTPPRSFIMVAGAGSGKTTSLIKALAAIIADHGETLKLRRQRVACITYTEIAAGEIWADVGNNPVVHVATIHSFMWSLVRAFQQDIKKWVTSRIKEKLREAQQAVANFGPRVQQRTREKNQRDIERYEQQLGRIDRVKAFTYGTGSDYLNGILGHDDIIKMVPDLLTERPLFRTLLAQQYPFLFIDESQDTVESVVLALKAVDQQLGDCFCLGFFGDPMQRIYATGIGPIPKEHGWAEITKPENFRCSTSILDVANAIRGPVGDLVQIRGRTIERDGETVSVVGNAQMFVLPIDDQRDARLAQVRRWMAQRTKDPAWETNEGVKMLVIVHRMAAKRLGFGDLYAALNDKAPQAFKDGFLDASAWPVRPFISFALPLADATRNGREFDAIQVLRSRSPLMSRDRLAGIDVAKRLAELRTLAVELTALMTSDGATNGDVLHLIHKSGLLTLDPRLVSYLNLGPSATAPDPAEEDDGEELSREIAAIEAFLACSAKQFWGYRNYVEEASPFSTQQGVKGAEFDRVLVVADDDEGTHLQFSYDKYLGLKPLSERDKSNLREGKETAVERTRRLFYVCCTRALQDLAVTLFTSDVDLAARQIRAMNLFPADAIQTVRSLEAG